MNFIAEIRPKIYARKMTVSKIFIGNEIDGSLLISAGLDDALLKELIPPLKQRIIFKTELLKLKYIV